MAETKEEVVLLLLHDWLQLCSYGGRPRVKIDFLFWPISTDFDRSNSTPTIRNSSIGKRFFGRDRRGLNSRPVASSVRFSTR
jgi:hypothetical protein